LVSGLRTGVRFPSPPPRKALRDLSRGAFVRLCKGIEPGRVCALRKCPGGAFSAQSGLAGTAPQVGWPSHQPAQQAVDSPRLHQIRTKVMTPLVLQLSFFFYFYKPL